MQVQDKDAFTTDLDVRPDRLFSMAYQRRLDELLTRRNAALERWQALTPGEQAASDALADQERLARADHAAARATVSLLGASGPAG